MREIGAAWAALAERGEWRGADAVAAAALAEPRESPNGQAAAPPARPRPAQELGAPHQRRLPGALVAALAFGVVVATVGAAILVAGGEGRPAATDAPLATAASPAAEPPAIPADFVARADWPSPALDPVLALPGCPTRPDAPAWFAPDRFFEFLGATRAGLAAADPAAVAATTPMLRAGHGSILSVDAAAGGCLLAVAGGGVTGWAVYLASGEPAMIALSAPAPGTFPESVSAAPGHYEQWRIATGEHFTGSVSADGQVHAVTADRLYVADFDPRLVPAGAEAGGWLLTSLAVAPGDPDRAVEQLDYPEVVPTALPPNYGLCAIRHAFLLGDVPEPQEENQEIVVCDGAGTAITVTGGFVPPPPAAAEPVTVNGHEMRRWAAGDGHALSFTRRGFGVRLDGPATIDAATLTAIAAALPLAAPAPPPPAPAVARLGVGDGLPAGTAAFSDPDPDDPASFRYDQWADRVLADGIRIDMSASMRAIHAEALAGLDAVPIGYRYESSVGGPLEEGDFAAPGRNARVTVRQQTLAAGPEWAPPIALVDETWGAWRLAVDSAPHSHEQVVAYSPSLARQVDVSITRLSNQEPFPVTAAEARTIAERVLAAIAVPG